MGTYGRGMGRPHIKKNFAPVSSNVARRGKRRSFRLKRPRVNVKSVSNFGFSFGG